MNADYWRKRADDARIAANWIQDPEGRQIMLDIARGYDRLADLASDKAKRASPTTPGW